MSLRQDNNDDYLACAVTNTGESEAPYSYQWHRVREWEWERWGLNLHVRWTRPIRGATSAVYEVPESKR